MTEGQDDPLHAILLDAAGIQIDEFDLDPEEAIDRVFAEHELDDARWVRLRASLLRDFGEQAAWYYDAEEEDEEVEYPSPADVGPISRSGPVAGHDGTRQPMPDAKAGQTGGVALKLISGSGVLAGLAASGAIAGLLLGQNGGEWWPWPALYLFVLAVPVAILASYAFLFLFALLTNVAALPARGLRILTRHRGN
jgi:hypothetical protein